MAKRTYRELLKVRDKLFRDIKLVQDPHSKINSQIARLIGYDKASHRGYWANESWRGDLDLPRSTREQIIGLVLKRKKLGQIIQGKYSELEKLEVAIGVAFHKKQKKPKLNRRKKS